MAIDIRSFSAADVPLGMHLKGQAGWNQTAADWHRLLALQPDGCFLAELNGRPVGTTAATIFGSVGWLSLVLVDREARGCGVATALVRHALAWLDSRSVPTVRLDATELGEPIYARLGFTADYGLAPGRAARNVSPWRIGCTLRQLPPPSGSMQPIWLPPASWTGMLPAPTAANCSSNFTPSVLVQCSSSRSPRASPGLAGCAGSERGTHRAGRRPERVGRAEHARQPAEFC